MPSILTSRPSLFEIDAFGLTPRSVAAKFAAAYWADPREVVAFNDADGTFQVKDGVRCYEIQLVRDGGIPAYRVLIVKEA